MPITDVSMRKPAAWGSPDTGKWVATFDIKWSEKPRDILATVAVTSLQTFPVSHGFIGEALYSYGGLWIIAWQDASGNHDHPEGVKAKFIQQCKRITFAIEANSSVVEGLCRIDYWD